jgi:hypothetical protein
MTRTADRVLWPSLWLTTLLFLGWGLVPRAALFTSVLSPVRLVGLAALAKLALLLLGTAWSWRSRAALEAGNPVRPAWTLLAGGLLATFLGQALLARYQLAGEPTPFPSAADVFYVLAYPLLGGALVLFVRAYDEVGLPIGTRAERSVTLAVAAVACFALAVPVLRPVLQADVAPLDEALSAAYPVLDMALMVPLALLLRITWRFRGGAVATAWVLVLSGFAFMCAGDILFAYLTALGKAGLDPFLHAAYILAYGLVAAGVRRHLGLLLH